MEREPHAPNTGGQLEQPTTPTGHGHHKGEAVEAEGHRELEQDDVENLVKQVKEQSQAL
jgi:hypothetical protein